MKKLILILLLSPLFLFSQTLVKSVSIVSYLDTPKKIHKSTDVLTNMSIYVENGYFYIKDDLETLNYKITKTHNFVDKGENVIIYEILIGKERYIAHIVYYKKSRALLLESIEDTDSVIFYDKGVD